MIDTKIAQVQVQRMIGLNFFPADKHAQRELVKVLEGAVTPEIARRVVDDWMGESADRPTPADLRRMIVDRNAVVVQQRETCKLCGGNGAVTEWHLITYKGESLQVLKSERLPDIDSVSQSYDYIERLAAFKAANPSAPRQTVLTAARLCQCRRAA